MRRSASLTGTLALIMSLALPPTTAHAQDSIGWKVRCAFSHRLMEDPIVYPGQKNVGHFHDFYGNETADGSSTAKTLEAGTTNCEFKPDRAGYWAPTLYYDGDPVKASEVDFYYRSLTYPSSAVRAFPMGLKMIAGDAHATAPQDHDVAYWGCDHGFSSQEMPIDCGSDNEVVAHVQFPDCWDGEHRDSKDHFSHMAYSQKDSQGDLVCPDSHPIALPKLILRLEWPISDGTKVSLASGPAYTLHADFLNAWKQKKLKRLVADCIRAQVNCGAQESPS